MLAAVTALLADVAQTGRDSGPGAAKWLLLAATLFLLAGAVLQAIIELARYVDLADSLGVSLSGHLTGWARDQYHAVGSDLRKLIALESVGESVSAAVGIGKRSLILVWWPWVTPFILYNLVRDGIHSWATKEPDGLTQLKAASARAIGWTFVMVGAALALASALVDLLAA
jgi:hypothetical protein